ncbi:MAG: hypothetical protein CM15mP25_0170 [Gammaproteobacteria bacterium]|nr:MAG: hypothetical protein CM15mP25_0170 [Gammaproteobacteria bacterium]
MCCSYQRSSVYVFSMKSYVSPGLSGDVKSVVNLCSAGCASEFITSLFKAPSYCGVRKVCFRRKRAKRAINSRPFHYCLAKNSEASLVGKMIRNLWVLASLGPQDDFITPWIAKSVIEAIKFTPIMVAPQDSAPNRSRSHDSISGIIGTY